MICYDEIIKTQTCDDCTHWRVTHIRRPSAYDEKSVIYVQGRWSFKGFRVKLPEREKWSLLIMKWQTCAQLLCVHYCNEFISTTTLKHSLTFCTNGIHSHHPDRYLSASLSAASGTQLYFRKERICFVFQMLLLSQWHFMSFIKHLKACTDGSHGTRTPLREREVIKHDLWLQHISCILIVKTHR